MRHPTKMRMRGILNLIVYGVLYVVTLYAALETFSSQMTLYERWLPVIACDTQSTICMLRVNDYEACLIHLHADFLARGDTLEVAVPNAVDDPSTLEDNNLIEWKIQSVHVYVSRLGPRDVPQCWNFERGKSLVDEQLRIIYALIFVVLMLNALVAVWIMTWIVDIIL